MRVRTFILASACSVFLAASAAVSGAATPENAMVAKAYKALQAGDAATAVADYGKAIESRSLEPEALANALLNRGLAYQRLNEHEFAIDDYTAALRIDAMSGKLRALALYNRGLSYQRLERNTLAMEDYTSALFLDGQFSHAYYSRGMLLRDTGQYLFALADFDKALRYEYPDPARVYFAQSIVFEKLKRTADAREALTRALAANPKYEPARQRLAVLDGTAGTQAASATASDSIETGAVSRAEDVLPAANAPSASLLGADSEGALTGSVKKFTDRVPAEPSRFASATPETQSDATVGAGEKILAVEEVPEDQPAPKQQASVEPASAPASEADAAPAAAPVSGWAVQLASATTEEAAWDTWKKMKARNKALASKEPVVVRADLGTKGVFYRVRLVGFDSQSDANSECSSLKKRGVKCYISKS